MAKDVRDTISPEELKKKFPQVQRLLESDFQEIEGQKDSLILVLKSCQPVDLVRETPEHPDLDERAEDGCLQGKETAERRKYSRLTAPHGSAGFVRRSPCTAAFNRCNHTNNPCFE